jgi:hypothetical protein
MTFDDGAFCNTKNEGFSLGYLSPRINSMQLKHVLCEVDSWSSTSRVRGFRSGDFAALT